MATKDIKGQAWINKTMTNEAAYKKYLEDRKTNKNVTPVDPVFRYDLVQEVITFETGKPETTRIDTLITDIYADLLASSQSHQYEKGGEKYFYWEYQMTDTTDDNTLITIKYECPKPYEGLITNYTENSSDGEYLAYWKRRLKTATENYEKQSVIQRKEVVFDGGLNWPVVADDENGFNIGTETIPNITIKNNDLGDITNLLNLF